MRVASVEASSFRSLDEMRVEIGPGITTITGPNGAGKTNLLEAVYFALTGRSFRTRDRRELIGFGEPLARSEVRLAPASGDSNTHTLLGSVSRSEGRRHLLDGCAADRATLARHRPHVVVFSPDRLVLVKGPPAERRAWLDELVAARWPARSDLRRAYGQVLAQRNALLRRVAAGMATQSELASWDGALAAAAAPLIAARTEAATDLEARFAAASSDLGLGSDAELRYEPRSEPQLEAVWAGLEERRESDLRSGRTSWGPHLDELQVRVGGRSLRRYGSQGEQRSGLLALLFAARESLMAADAVVPLMLLDDVMSELDHEHRELLAARLADGGQSLVTAADEAGLPGLDAARSVRMPTVAGVPETTGLAVA